MRRHATNTDRAKRRDADRRCGENVRRRERIEAIRRNAAEHDSRLASSYEPRVPQGFFEAQQLPLWPISDMSGQ